MNDQPLISVNILSYNRKNDLRTTLTKVYGQCYKNIEIIVVDNASGDGSAEMVASEFPAVKLVQLEKNIGIAAWNEGFKLAKGDYVLVLDDDSYPEDNAIQEAMNKFSDDVGIVAFNIFNIARNISETESFRPPYVHFVGCGALIKKAVFNDAGGFDPGLFIYCHETDFAIRVCNIGYRIDYSAGSRVIHRASSVNHPILNKRYFYFSTLNNIILNKKYLSGQFVPVTLKYIFNRVLVAMFYGYLIELLKAVKSYIKISPTILRVPVKTGVLGLFNYRKPPLFDREYFGNLLNSKSKLLYPVLYIKYLFASSETKKRFVR